MMNPKTRREFLTDATGIAATTLLATRSIGAVHWAGTDTVQVALVGCGGRGTGAVHDALSVKRGPVRLVAMADAFEDRLKTSHDALAELLTNDSDVPVARRFTGFD